MKKALLLAGVILLFYACKEKKSGKEIKKENSQEQVVQQKAKNDTIIVKRKTENAGELVYFPVVRKDTIGFEVIFTNVTDGSRIAEIHFKNTLPYSTQYRFLELIFRKASEEASFFRLGFIDINTLPETGDLAIAVTRQLLQENEDLEEQLKDYENVSDLLMGTKITSDFNALLQPYRMKVNEYDLEKVFLMDRKYLSEEVELETPSGEIPDKVLEAIVWIKVVQAQGKGE